MCSKDLLPSSLPQETRQGRGYGGASPQRPGRRDVDRPAAATPHAPPRAQAMAAAGDPSADQWQRLPVDHQEGHQGLMFKL